MPTHSAHGSFQAVTNQDELVCIIRANYLLNSSYNLYYQTVNELARVILNLDELESFLVFMVRNFLKLLNSSNLTQYNLLLTVKQAKSCFWLYLRIQAT